MFNISKDALSKRINFKFNPLLKGNKFLYCLYHLFYRNKFHSFSADLLLDGYPRCGNTFAVRLINECNPDIRILHHLHSATALYFGIKQGIPVIVLIRSPLDAIVSEYLRRRRWLNNPSIQYLFKYYYNYYSYVKNNMNYICIIDFNTLINHPDIFMKHVWKSLDADTSSTINYHKIADHVLSIMTTGITENKILSVSAPSAKRDKIKPIIKKYLKDNYKMELNYVERLYDDVNSQIII